MSNVKKQTSFNLSDLHSALATTSPGLSAEDRAGLMSAVQEKLQKLAGNRSEALSPKVRKRVEALMEIQSQHNEFEAKYFEERAALHAKYQKLYEPLYTKRYEIVNGVIEVEGIAEEILPKGKTSEEKGVPDFWLTAMNNHEVLTEEIQEGDEEALKFLRDIKCSKLDDTRGFKLEFFFDPNPYFNNSVLTKAYHMIDEDEPLLEKAIGTEIEWYPGKCLTQKVVIKKPRKGSRNTNPIKKIEKCESVFNFFSPPLVPESAADIDEDAAERLQGLMEQDYEIGSTIRDKIIPHAVSWFTGEAAEGDDSVNIELEDIDEEDSEEEEEDEDDDDDDDEADDEDEDDEDEDEDEVAGKSKEPKRRQKKSGGGEDQLLDRPAECKQQ